MRKQLLSWFLIITLAVGTISVRSVETFAEEVSEETNSQSISEDDLFENEEQNQNLVDAFEEENEIESSSEIIDSSMNAAVEDGKYYGILQNVSNWDFADPYAPTVFTIDGVDYYVNDDFDYSNSGGIESLFIDHKYPYYCEFEVKDGYLIKIYYKRALQKQSVETETGWTSSISSSEMSTYNKQLQLKFADAVNSFLKTTGKVLRKEAEKTKSDNDVYVDDLVQKLKKKTVLTFDATWPVGWSKDEVYRTFAEEIVTIVNSKATLSSVYSTDPLEYSIGITNSVISDLKHIDNEEKTNSSGTITYNLNILAYAGAAFGTITCTDNKTDKAYTVTISMSELQTRMVISDYTKELAELSKNTANMVYGTLAEELLGCSISDLTSGFISNKISVFLPKLKEIGLEKIITICESSYKLYNMIPQLTYKNNDPQGAISNAKEILDSLDKDAANLSSTVAKRAGERVVKIGKELISDLENYLLTGEKPEKGVKGFLKNIFSCPVNISVYDSNGTNIGYVGEDDIWFDDTLYIEELGDAKIVYSLSNQELSFTVSAYRKGEFAYCLEGYNQYEEIIGRTIYGRQSISCDDVIIINTSGTYSSDSENATYLKNSEQISPRMILTYDEYADHLINVNTSISEGKGYIAGGGSYLPGSAVVLSAVPANEYIFLGWYDRAGMLISRNNDYEFSAENNLTLYAKFLDKYASNNGETIDFTPQGFRHYLVDATRYDYDFANLDETKFYKAGAIGGECGASSSWKYYVREGVLKVEGEGSVGLYQYPDGTYNWDYFSTDNLIQKVLIPDPKPITSIVVEDGITEIEDNAFSTLIFVFLKDVFFRPYSYLKDLVTYGGIARGRTDTVESIALSDSVEVIGNCAFFNNQNLKYIRLGKNLRKIGAFAFVNCKKLEQIEVSPENTYFTTINGNLYSKDGKTLYKDLSYATDITIPEGVEVIYAGAISDNDQLKVCHIPSTLTEIGLHAFDGASSLTDVYYNGTYEEFKSIYTYYNFARHDMVIHCTDRVIPKDEHDYKTTIEKEATPDFTGVGIKTCILCNSSEKYIIPKVTGALITKQPVNTSAGLNQKAVFHINASYASSYQWQYSKNGGAKWTNCSASGNTTDTLSVTVTSSNAANSYRCIVTGPNGEKLISDTAGVDLLTGVVITLNPKSNAVAIGEYAIFTVETENAASFQWQYSKDGAHWYKSGAEGNQTDTLTVKGEQKSQGNRYRCVVTGIDGNTKKSYMAAMIVMTEAPKTCTAAVGEMASYTVRAEGIAEYQWQYSKDGGQTWYKSSAVGATTDTVTFKASTSNRAMIYRCKLTTPDEATAFTKAVGFAEGLKIIEQPVDVKAAIGAKATFRVVARNVESYQWQYSKDGVKWSNSGIATAKTDSITVTVAEANKNNVYRCKLVGTDGAVEYTNTVAVK